MHAAACPHHHHPNTCMPRSPAHLLSFFLGLRGGVTGRPIFMPPYGYFAFFSAGFSICSRTCKSLLNVKRNYSDILETNTVVSRPHSSSHPHCQTLHSNLAQKIMSLNVSLRRTRTHPRQPVKAKEKKNVSTSRDRMIFMSKIVGQA
jgi:hypothetical protein